MKCVLLTCVACVALISGVAQAEPIYTASPNNRNAVAVSVNEKGAITYEVSRNGETIIKSSPLGLVLKNNPLFGTNIGTANFKLSEISRQGRTHIH